MPFGSPVPGAIVVNATPLGMNGESLPSGLLDQASGLIDLAYGPVDPPATVEARRRGLPLVDGVEFLALQAARVVHLVDRDTSTTRCDARGGQKRLKRRPHETEMDGKDCHARSESSGSFWKPRLRTSR